MPSYLATEHQVGYALASTQWVAWQHLIWHALAGRRGILTGVMLKADIEERLELLVGCSFTCYNCGPGE